MILVQEINHGDSILDVTSLHQRGELVQRVQQLSGVGLGEHGRFLECIRFVLAAAAAARYHHSSGDEGSKEEHKQFLHFHLVFKSCYPYFKQEGCQLVTPL